MITQKQYEVIDNWNKEKTFHNFYQLYKYGFLYENIFIKPFWRIWRIFRNTYINKKYLDIYLTNKN